MKKTFSREYWFLVSCWAVFTLLGLAAGALGGLSPDSGALWRFKDPVMAYTGVQTAAAVLLSAANALSGAAAGMIAIRYWVKPYLLLWLLMLVWDAGTVWPALIRSGGIGYAGLSLLSLLLTNVLTREEGAFLTLLGAAAILWSAVLMVLGLKVVHEFSFGRTVLAVLYSLIGILIILFLALLLWSLFQQLAMFLVSLYDELSLKLK